MIKNSSKKGHNNLTGKSFLSIMVAVTLSFSIISVKDMMSNYVNAQNTTTAAANNQTQSGQLSFFLKLADNSNQTAQTKDPSNLKNITINVNIQQGQEPPKKLPITALVPKDTTLEQLELCGSVGVKPEQCQPLTGGKVSLDLTGQQGQNSTSTASTAPST